MEPQVFEHKPTGRKLTMQPFSEGMVIAYLSAYNTYKVDDVHLKIHERDWMVKAALDCGWIALEPPLTSAEVEGTSGALINWLVNGRKSNALATLVAEALSLPKD